MIRNIRWLSWLTLHKKLKHNEHIASYNKFRYQIDRMVACQAYKITVAT